MHLDICLDYICIIHKHRLTILFILVFQNIIGFAATTSHSNTTYVNYSEIIKSLEHSTNANVYVKGSHLYNTKRRIHNGLCDNLFPDVIVEPKSTYDVSEIVKIARRVNVPISVRSGGHSYICGSIRNGMNIKTISMNQNYNFLYKSYVILFL